MTRGSWKLSIAAAALLAAGCFDLRMPDQVNAGSLNCGGGRYDPASELCWQHPTNEQQYYWQDAIDYCGELDLGEQTDWRLPTVEELMDMLGGCNVDLVSGSGGNCNSCSGSENCQALFDPNNNNWGWGNYWSSSSCSVYTPCAWAVNFSDGWVNTADVSMTLYGVRCVRSDADIDTETETDTGTDTEIQGLGQACSNGGGECSAYEASFCVYDPMYPGDGVCTVTGCNLSTCPTAYTCCDCTSASYFFDYVCTPAGMVGALTSSGCTCG
jgi:hypothetical protein